MRVVHLEYYLIDHKTEMFEQELQIVVFLELLIVQILHKLVYENSHFLNINKNQVMKHKNRK